MTRLFPARPVAQIIRFGAGNQEVLPLAECGGCGGWGQNPCRLGSGVGDTVDFDRIKRHCYQVHAGINPTRTVPLGPGLSGWLTPYGRDALGRCPFGDGTPPGTPPPAEAVPLAHAAV